MEISINLNEKEVQFLEKMMAEMKSLGMENATMGDALRQCITMAMYEEAEEGS